LIVSFTSFAALQQQGPDQSAQRPLGNPVETSGISAETNTVRIMDGMNPEGFSQSLKTSPQEIQELLESASRLQLKLASLLEQVPHPTNQVDVARVFENHNDRLAKTTEVRYFPRDDDSALQDIKSHKQHMLLLHNAVLIGYTVVVMAFVSLGFAYYWSINNQRLCLA
jgi:hypothetical protein